MTATQSMEVGSRLIHLLTQQQLLYRQLQELARKQSDLVDGKDPETLLRVLAGRQRLIDRLSAIDRELRPIRRDWQEIARSLPADQRERAQELVSSVQEILAEILARDARDTQKLSNQHEEVGGALRVATAGKRVHHAYARAGTAEENHRYLDTQSG